MLKAAAIVAVRQAGLVPGVIERQVVVVGVDK
jgi:hypothetical protein